MQTRSPRRAPPRPLGSSALSHGVLAAFGACSLVLLALTSCGSGAANATGSPTPAPSAEELTGQLDQLVAAVTPIDPTSTSDKQDAWLLHQRELIERLRQGPPELGAAALERFATQRDKLLDVRAALLDIAAHCAPEATAPVLEQSIRTYDGQDGLGLRTRAVEFLADTSPQRAITLFEPLLRENEVHATRPAQEAFVRGWALAARKLGITEAVVLCDLAVDLKQPADARYAAITELGKFGGRRAMKALEEILVEAASDGLMRRKAAQALVDIMPRKEFCERVTEVSAHESDENFLYFLDSMLQRYCAQ